MTIAPSRLRCAYLTGDALDQTLGREEWQAASVLGGVCFAQPENTRSLEQASQASGLSTLTAAPFARLSMAPLNTGRNGGAHVGVQPDCMYEIWFADGAIVRGQHGPVRYSHNGELVYGVIQIDEQQFDGAQSSSATSLHQASQQAYTTLFSTLDTLGYPAILRIWNYIADINGGSSGESTGESSDESSGVERYRQFNSGRQEGFLASGRAVVGTVPAASAVGMKDGPLTICFLASRGAAPTPIENPRQVSAYRYPPQYGATSPTFSRAGVASVAGRELLFLSGTASIVGHQTLHGGDVIAQARETLANISAVLEEVRRVRPGSAFALADLFCKVYVREPADVGALDEALRNLLGPVPCLLYVQADICRAALALEIEATAGHPVALSA